MKKQLFALILPALVIVSMTSCKKDSKKSNTELITQSAWKLQTVGIDNDKNGTVDLEDAIDACSKDDLTTFATNGTGVVDEGATKCDPTDPQTTSFTWSFANNETELNFDGDTFLLTVVS
jgi:hypothetical protein